MIKKFRLEFITKKPAALKSSWCDLINDGLLVGNMFGILTGIFSDNSHALTRVLNKYERDKALMQVRMEATCVVEYEQEDFEASEYVKYYPQTVELIGGTSRKAIHCTECSKINGYKRDGELVIFPSTNVDDYPILSTDRLDLILREDLVDQIQVHNNLKNFLLRPVEISSTSSNWMEVIEGPTASLVGKRTGFCSNCNNAVTTNQLPEIDEKYKCTDNLDFFLSPNLPAGPCFSKKLSRWLLEVSPKTTWAHFKPIVVEFN